MITVKRAEAAVFLFNRTRADAFRDRHGRLMIATERRRVPKIVALLGRPDAKRPMPVNPASERRPLCLIYEVKS